MEFENHKIVHDFLTETEREELINYVNDLSFVSSIDNVHIKTVAEKLNGSAYMFDLSETSISNYLSTFQSSGNLISKNLLPLLIFGIKKRIAEALCLSDEHCFLQIIDMNKGGKITPHYDTAFTDHITYKCNISLLSHPFTLYVDKHEINIRENDLYCFEASLFKHHTNEFKSRRILLSYGFSVPISAMNRTENDVRVRLSNRIFNHFQK